MQAIELKYIDIEVTPEEEEAWKIFLIKFNDKEKILNFETTIPKENLNGVFGSSN